MAAYGYFRRTTRFWMITIAVSFGFFTMIVFAPDLIPYDCLGPFGSFCSHLVDYHAELMYKGWWAAVAIHVLEALYAIKLCSEKGINNPNTRWRWFIQTLLFGYASLSLLNKYSPKRQKRY